MKFVRAKLKDDGRKVMFNLSGVVCVAESADGGSLVEFSNKQVLHIEEEIDAVYKAVIDL